VGTQLRGYCERLTGVDVASAMIAKAEEKAVYDKLLIADVTKTLVSSTDRYDLVVCADVLIYVGALEVLFEAVAARVNAGARFIFSTELLEDGDLKLQSSGRFAHSDAYVRRCADDVQLSVTIGEPIQLRMERGQWIPGNLYVLSATTAN
jgi:predicted TPR repeat methyltransferase